MIIMEMKLLIIIILPCHYTPSLTNSKHFSVSIFLNESCIR